MLPDQCLLKMNKQSKRDINICTGRFIFEAGEFKKSNYSHSFYRSLSGISGCDGWTKGDCFILQVSKSTASPYCTNHTKQYITRKLQSDFNSFECALALYESAIVFHSAKAIKRTEYYPPFI